MSTKYVLIFYLFIVLISARRFPDYMFNGNKTYKNGKAKVGIADENLSISQKSLVYFGWKSIIDVDLESSITLSHASFLLVHDFGKFRVEKNSRVNVEGTSLLWIHEHPKSNDYSTEDGAQLHVGPHNSLELNDQASMAIFGSLTTGARCTVIFLNQASAKIGNYLTGHRKLKEIGETSLTLAGNSTLELKNKAELVLHIGSIFVGIRSKMILSPHAVLEVAGALNIADAGILEIEEQAVLRYTFDFHQLISYAEGIEFQYEDDYPRTRLSSNANTSDLSSLAFAKSNLTMKIKSRVAMLILPGTHCKVYESLEIKADLVLAPNATYLNDTILCSSENLLAM